MDAKVAASHAASDGVYDGRGSWPTCALPVSRCPARRWRPGLAVNTLAGISPRTFAPATTVADAYAPLPKDLVGRRFDTGVLDRVWTSATTYLRTGQGRLYLRAP
ncbi:MAG TPA: hypothetical protein VEF72_21300 [Mycobacterium sp.]|nr:hypothetical protein [Mycobacterium sp.]